MAGHAGRPRSGGICCRCSANGATTPRRRASEGVQLISSLGLYTAYDTFEPIITPQRAIKEWVHDDEPTDLWDQTADFQNAWNHCPAPNPKLREIDLGDGRILVACFD